MEEKQRCTELQRRQKLGNKLIEANLTVPIAIGILVAKDNYNLGVRGGSFKLQAARFKLGLQPSYVASDIATITVPCVALLYGCSLCDLGHYPPIPPSQSQTFCSSTSTIQ